VTVIFFKLSVFVIFLFFALSGFSSRGIKNDQIKDKNAYYSEKLDKNQNSL